MSLSSLFLLVRLGLPVGSGPIHGHFIDVIVVRLSGEVSWVGGVRER